LKQNPVYFPQISFHRRGVRIDERRRPVYRPPLQFWGNFSNSKTPGRIFRRENKNSLASWSKAFPPVSAKSLIGKQVSLHLLEQIWGLCASIPNQDKSIKTLELFQHIGRPTWQIH
jgi:hypothetical protein